MDANKERLRQSLTDKEYREQYADSTLVGDIAIQVQALRRQRGLSQEDLAKRIGSKQPKISSVETPANGDKLPNWELGTLNRIAHALGTRLKVRFETYGSLVDEFGTLTTESLRRPDENDDPVLFPKPPMPELDAKAPERTRWMQALMIPWLWEDRLDISRLIGWLQGRGLPPVGYEEEPYHWLLRGISVPERDARDHLEKRFAERLAIVLGEQPDVHAIVESDPDEFLLNLYWTCAGLVRPGFLAEQLWRAYQRLKGSKLNGAVRDALQGALVHNQFGETKPLKELWTPMVEKGRHHWLRGDELVGYEGILLRHRTIKADLDSVFWALGGISRLWKEGTARQQAAFARLISEVPDIVSRRVVDRMIDYALRPGSGWMEWAQALLRVEHNQAPEKATIKISLSPVENLGQLEAYGEWRKGQPARVGCRNRSAELIGFDEEPYLPGEPKILLLANAVLTMLGNAADSRPEMALSARLGHSAVFRFVRPSRPLQMAPAAVTSPGR